MLPPIKMHYAHFKKMNNCPLLRVPYICFYSTILVSRHLCWKDHLDFCRHAVWMYVWMDVGCSTKKVNFHFSNENAVTDFRKTWYVGRTTHVVCRH